VAAGSFHSLALTSQGNVYAWGWNNYGQLGMGSADMRPNIPYPSEVLFFASLNSKVIKLAAGFSHSAAVTSGGVLYTWGNNKYGQLGQGDYLARRLPTAVSGFYDSNGRVLQVFDVACGLYHCLALSEQGLVWSFGLNSRGQLGTCD
ncbi:hypothetical protein GUITHDRAFT_56334, partial [Guillardia theta CCMP2712]